jgi:phosphatidate cytidylyltransferase
MVDDTTKGDSGEFDDWLDEKPGPATDPTNPYQDLASDDADEIAEWMAFTSASPSSEPETETSPPPASELEEAPSSAVQEPDNDREQPAPEVAPEVVVETGEIEVVATSETDGDEDPADDAEVDAAPDLEDQDLQDAETVEIDAVDIAAMTSAANDSPHSSSTPPDRPDDSPSTPPEGPDVVPDPDDTGEIEAVPIAPYGGYAPDPEPIPPQSRELFDLSESDYLSTATTEHTNLAEAVATASAQDTAQVPITAPIPGMTDTVVGFEDVVAAEGIGRVRAKASGDLIARVITAVVLIAALGASLIWQPVLAIFALAVFLLGASEFYTSLVRADYKPIGIFGFIGIVGASVGAYYWGSLAIPISFVLAVALLLLYYAVVPGKTDPLGNLALTITVMVWVGLGAYTMLIVVSDSYRPLVMGVVVTVAAMDIAQYFVGRAIGRTPLSPWVSPKKTIEGLVAGIFVAMVVGALLHFVHPFELTSGLALGAAVAILAPLGDLAMSAAKRSLGLKDMGSVLPGHGGFLDRIDGLLFVIPAAWVVFLWAGIL